MNKKKSKQAKEPIRKTKIRQSNEKRQEKVIHKKKSLSLKEEENSVEKLEEEEKSTKKHSEPKAEKKHNGENSDSTSKAKVKKQTPEPKPVATEDVEVTQETEENADIKKEELLNKPNEDSKKIGNSEDPKCKVEKTDKVMDQEEPLPEIKEGTMEIADGDDPKYKTLYIFMDKKTDIFGPDKWKPGQPEIGTMKKISDDGFAAEIDEIKARYGAIAKAGKGTEIHLDALFQAKNMEKEGSVLIFTLPAEVVSKNINRLNVRLEL
uniref:Uncharacterized protein n=1 Tax=Elaeophora elaphi TaxID=1147741 RepID=A0A0R3S2V7_9BILA